MRVLTSKQIGVRPAVCAVLLTCLYSPSAHAGSDEAAKIEALEARVLELEQRLNAVLGMPQTPPSQVPQARVLQPHPQVPQARVLQPHPQVPQTPPSQVPQAQAPQILEQTHASVSTAVDNALPMDKAKTLTPYLNARIRIANAHGNTQLTNGSSRGGFKLNREITRGVNAIGRLEWQINLTDDNTSFSAGDATNSDIVNVANADTFSTRLGYIGLDFARYGRLTFGKQWSAYSDVANFTDEFPVFGGDASGMYNAGTDGGAFGTGRAERAVQYQLSRDNFTFTAQTQLQGAEILQDNTYGLALRYRPLDWFEIGAAYNQANVDADRVSNIIRIRDNPKSVVVAGRITAGPWYAALGVSDHTQTEIGYIDGNAVLLDSRGIEAIARYSLNDTLRLIGGYNDRDVDHNDTLDTSANLKYYVLGADYYWTPQSYFYVTARFNQDDAPFHQDDDGQSNQYVIGYNLDF